MRVLGFVALTLVGLVASGVMPLAEGAMPRRALAASNYVNTCYDKSRGSVARWAIDYMCADVTKGATETWLMELADAACAKGKVTVTLNAKGEPVATHQKGFVCKTINRRVAVDAHMCANYATGRNNLCRGYIDDRAKAAKSYNIMTVHEVPEPKYSATVRFQVRLKVKCRSLANPKYLGWFGTAQLLEGRSCFGAEYWGDFTWGEVPKNPWAPAPTPNGGRTPGPGPTPNGSPSPSPGRSPPDDHDDDDDDHHHDDDRK